MTDLKNLKDWFNDLVDLMKKYHELAEYRAEELKKDPSKESQLGSLSYFSIGIINRMKENPEILTIQDEDGKNLGMHAALNEMEDVVLFALENHEASVQQSQFGDNIGMVAATFGLRKATIKALENPIASSQKNKDGETIEDIAKKMEMDIDTKGIKKRPVKNSNKSEEEMNNAISNIYDEILGM